MAYYNYHFETSNLGDSTLIYIQVAANKLGKLCSYCHAYAAISENSENMADSSEYETSHIHWQTFQCENLSRFLWIGNTQKEELMQVQDMENESADQSELDKFIFVEEMKHKNVRGDGDGRS